ncbi:MAG: ABC transporter ATP-binding protein [Gammaproteobacteria bacterium]
MTSDAEETDGDSAYAVRCRDVSKSYPLIDDAFSGLSYLVRYALGETNSAERVNHVKALRSIDLDIKRGERVGLIGRNGSGKTTFLKLLSGQLPPTSGELRVNGGMYYLGAGTIGLDPELTGRQGISAFLVERGTPSNALPEILEELESFLELHEYFDQPIKHYSLGMRARTEFAAATAITADIILVDEILGAGDMFWAEKCSRRMERLCAQGRTMLIVSHSLGQILRFCDRAVWIDVGRIVMDGPVQTVVRRYEAFLENLSWKTADLDDKAFDAASLAHELTDVQLPRSNVSVMRWPARGDVLIEGIWINDSSNTSVTSAAGMPVRIRIALECIRGGQYALRYLITFWTLNGKRVGIVENEVDRVVLKSTEKHEVEVTIGGGNIGPGIYAVTVSLFQVSEAGSSANEYDARQDMIYKSYTLLIEHQASTNDWRPPAIHTVSIATKSDAEADATV